MRSAKGVEVDGGGRDDAILLFCLLPLVLETWNWMFGGGKRSYNLEDARLPSTQVPTKAGASLVIPDKSCGLAFLAHKVKCRRVIQR